MTISASSGIVRRIREDRDSFTIMVKKPDDQDAALRGLRAAAIEIGQLDGGWQSAPGLRPGDRNGPKYVSEVLATAVGPMVTIDGGFTPMAVLKTIPEIIVRHLEAAGVKEARVVSPTQGGRLTNMFGENFGLRRAVALCLYPPPPTRWFEQVRIPDEWLVEGARWVTEGLTPDAVVHCSVVASEFSIASGDSVAFLRQRRDGPASSYQVVSGRLGHRIRSAVLDGKTGIPAVSLAAGGPDAADEEMLAIFDDLVEIARRLAPSVAYACVSIDATFRGHCGATPYSPGFDGEADIDFAIDEFAIDGLPYQILGDGHMTRLGTVPNGARSLGNGKTELAVGHPSDWLLGEPMLKRELELPYNVQVRRRDPLIQRRAREILAPCLLERGDVNRLNLRESRLGPHPAQQRRHNSNGR